MSKEIFDSFSNTYKIYNEDDDYSNLENYVFSFESKILELENVHDTDELLNEMNTISRKIFKYGAMHEMQSNVLQKLEDNFSMWYAEKYTELDGKKYTTEKAKEIAIKVNYQQDYTVFQEKIREEKYKLGLLKRVLSSMESYNFKLHAIFNYRQSAEKMGG